MSHPPQLTEVDISCVLDALCCLCVADNRISRGEFSVVLEALKAAGVRGSEHELRARVEARCRAIHKAGIRKCAEATIAAVRTAGNPQLGDLICRLQATALSADGRVMERESEVARLFRDAFPLEVRHHDAMTLDGHVSGDGEDRGGKHGSNPTVMGDIEHCVDHARLLWLQRVVPFLQAIWRVPEVATQGDPPSHERLADTRSVCRNPASALPSMRALAVAGGAVAALFALCIGIVAASRQRAENHGFRKELFTNAHRAAIAWDGESFPDDLGVECRLLEPAARTTEEKAVYALLSYVFDVQSCSALLAGLLGATQQAAATLESMHSEQRRREIANLRAHARSVQGLPYEYHAEFDPSAIPGYPLLREQVEMLEKGYVVVDNAVTTVPFEQIQKFGIPYVEGKYGKYVEYSPARNRLSRLAAATISTIGKLINNRGQLP